MRLSKVSVKNYRSITAALDVRIEPLQALVGENNCGKSNILRAIRCFLSAGAGGVEVGDFKNPDENVLIECEFSALTPAEKKRLRRYLLGERVILRKELRIVTDERSQKVTVKPEYHGYQAEPKETRYSIKKIEEAATRPNWKKAAEEAGLAEAALTPDGKITKKSFTEVLENYLSENDVEYDEPTLGETQALGIPQNLLSALPRFYLLPAITDYSSEIDRRSSSTVFRQLMADLSERLLQTDPRYTEIEEALQKVRALLNPQPGAGATPRLEALGNVETELRDLARRLMPSVNGISLAVEIDPPKDMFSKGIAIKIDDGVLTDVLDKGHGMQRTLVFALLQMLMKAGTSEGMEGKSSPILLAIEEPELYIHPHCQRLIYGVLKQFAGLQADDTFSGTDQVIYTTHSPAFVDIAGYERIGVVRKADVATGTVVKQCAPGVLGAPAERKAFKLLTSFDLHHNEVFFAREAILTEGPEDAIGLISTARKLGRIKELPEEIGLSIVVTDGKGEIPKFQKVLNAFGLSYGVLLELDGEAEDHRQNAPVLEHLNGNRVAKVTGTLEKLLGLTKHFDDVRHAKEFFSDPNNIPTGMEEVTTALLPPV